MRAVILAGGLGTRLSEETNSIPKPMVRIGEQPILWHIMKVFHAYGIREFIICGGYKVEVIREYFANYTSLTGDVCFDIADGTVTMLKRDVEPWKVSVIDTGLNTQTGGRIKRIAEYLDPDEPFLMTYGDGLADVDIAALIEFHKSHGALASVTAVRPPARWGALSLDGTKVTGFSEKVQSVGSFINGGFFVIDPAALSVIDNDKTIWERVPLERLAESGNLRAFVHEGFWQPMDTLREKHLLADLWADGQAPWRVWD